MGTVEFLNDNGVFGIKNPENYSYLYFPIAGEKGIKGSVTPNFGGDSKIDQNSFLLEPVSSENLHNNRSVRNFWCNIEGKGAWSAVGASAAQDYEKFTESQDESCMTAGFMWQRIDRTSNKYGIKSEVTAFVPHDKNVEIMLVTIENIEDDIKVITPTAAIPMFARSADNIRDHRHVTSLLHRIKTNDYGVVVKPTLSFDERGHKKNNLSYFVCGMSENGEKPEEFFPVTEDFMGEGGNLSNPRAVVQSLRGVGSGFTAEGKEALGGLRFKEVRLGLGERASFTIVMGITGDEAEIESLLSKFSTKEKVRACLEETKAYWNDEVNVSYNTGDKDFDGFMKWVSFQPFLRRIYGCSFLPHHDYGRGGRGWRDLWQDCLSLLIMDPSGVRRMILDNYGGVRIDGTNATIIGAGQGEFIADRNGIARVWMDHGVWPFITTKLYIDQTGDVDILKETATYFKDEQKERGTNLDREWDESYGVCQRTASGEIYRGTILEHILLEQLCAFYEVGEHNHIRLRGADWNDALDMAAENGESVAFTCAYAGNLMEIAELLDTLAGEYEWKEVELLEEMVSLISCDPRAYDSVQAKKEVLNEYLLKCGHTVSGNRVSVNPEELAKDLKVKADWIMRHVRETEWISGDEDKSDEGWFNSYYDNSKNKVEGYFPNEVRMMLTGQVFSVMSRCATEEQVKKICVAADRYLYREELGGYRLNTNFHEEKLDLGRMFGFAYGEKENGAVFSHMAVMYANALYRRGFVKEGYKALSALSKHAMNFEGSKIYPGIPEYFDGSGRGLYHYLTGAASWYMLTFITEVFGVKGQLGYLVIEPKLVAGQFDENGRAELTLNFAGKRFNVVILNPERLEYDVYTVKKAVLNGDKELSVSDERAVLSAGELEELDRPVNTIEVTLG